jgi:hypothetical protein
MGGDGSCPKDFEKLGALAGLSFVGAHFDNHSRTSALCWLGSLSRYVSKVFSEVDLPRFSSMGGECLFQSVAE